MRFTLYISTQKLYANLWLGQAQLSQKGGSGCAGMAGSSSNKPKMGSRMCRDGLVELNQAKNGAADVLGDGFNFFLFLSTTPFSGISFLSHVSELIDAANIDVIIASLQTRISTVSSAIPAHPRPHFWLYRLDQAIQAHPRPHFRLA